MSLSLRYVCFKKDSFSIEVKLVYNRSGPIESDVGSASHALFEWLGIAVLRKKKVLPPLNRLGGHW